MKITSKISEYLFNLPNYRLSQNDRISKQNITILFPISVLARKFSLTLHSAFCTLHFIVHSAFCTLHFINSALCT